MSLLRVMAERARGMRRPDDFMEPGPHVELDEKPTGQVRGSFVASEEWELSATVKVRYWANPAQRAEARRIAELQLAHLLYSDFLSAVLRAQAAVAGGDRVAAQNALGALQDLIRGG